MSPIRRTGPLRPTSQLYCTIAVSEVPTTTYCGRSEIACGRGKGGNEGEHGRFRANHTSEQNFSVLVVVTSTPFCILKKFYGLLHVKTFVRWSLARPPGESRLVQAMKPANVCKLPSSVTVRRLPSPARPPGEVRLVQVVKPTNACTLPSDVTVHRLSSPSATTGRITDSCRW